MRILIPTILSSKYSVGVTVYLINLLENLQNIDKKNEYYIITSSDNYHFFNILGSNFSEIRIKMKESSRLSLRLKYLLWQYFALPILIRKNKIDILHIPTAWFPLPFKRTISTVHDIIEVNIKKYNIIFNWIKKIILFSAIKHSKKIITVSESSKLDILKIKSCDVQVIHNGVNFALRSKLEATSILTELNLIPQNYFIQVGTLQKHKNLINLVKAFSIFLESTPNFKLVLVGKLDNEFSALKKLIKLLNLEANIIITGPLSENNKNTLIHTSIALFLVSQYEGFGLPVLEAQCLGVPVVISDIPALREISGDSAIIINPNKTNEIADAMRRIHNDERLRIDLITKGDQNYIVYPWKKCAQETLEVYEAIMVSIE